MKPDIKSRRKELNLTLEQVGDLVGVGKSTVRKMGNWRYRKYEER